ncbi:hypothetical protein N665_0185s0069 [Sinapis alba]|nr:hypothetical protein N665_0185s0069 [Sinapis alba]
MKVVFQKKKKKLFLLLCECFRLQMLRLIATALKDVGPCSMFYLAAAVSDFYVPWKSMTEHKIESGSGPLDIRLSQVPKMLSTLRTTWAPKAFCISFKLETDSKILMEKATKALRKYKVHAVVANELSTRKEEISIRHTSKSLALEIFLKCFKNRKAAMNKCHHSFIL